jgi:AraC-like DNA-binding protein
MPQGAGLAGQPKCAINWSAFMMSGGLLTLRGAAPTRDDVRIGVEDYTRPLSDAVPKYRISVSFPKLVCVPQGGAIEANMTEVDVADASDGPPGRARLYSIRPRSVHSGLPEYRLDRVLTYIGCNLTGDLSLTRLSEVAGMSSHYFAERFRLSTGHSPHRYLLLQRIERAKEKLREPGCSVIEAGLDAGFQNASHFARVFRKLVGSSPSEFKSHMRVPADRDPPPGQQAAGAHTPLDDS